MGPSPGLFSLKQHCFCDLNYKETGFSHFGDLSAQQFRLHLIIYTVTHTSILGQTISILLQLRIHFLNLMMEEARAAC